MKTKTLVFLNEKGGVGKSSLSTIFAAMLAADGHRVVFIDGDAQGNSTEFFGLAKAPNFYNFMTLPQAELPKVTITRRVAADHYASDPTRAGELHVIGSDFTSGDLATMIKFGKLPKNIVRQRVKLLAGFADYIVFDTAPEPSELLKAIAAAGDWLVMPTDCEAFSGLQGVPDTKAHMENVQALGDKAGFDASKLVAIIPNVYHKKSAVDPAILAILRDTYGALVWEEIPYTETIKQAHLQRKSLNVLYPNTKITKLLWKMARRIEAMV